MKKLYMSPIGETPPGGALSKLKHFFLFVLFTCLSIGFSYGQLGNNLVISEVYGGGGNTGAPFSHDFVEIYNPTSADITMNNWSVQYAAVEGTSWGSGKAVISGVVKAKGYFLVRGASGNGVTPITDFDFSSGLSISALRGKVVLVSNETTVTGADPTGPNIIDKVGWGTGPAANGFEGAPGPPTTTSTSLEKKANSYATAASMASGGADFTKGNGQDSDDNSFDFINSVTPTPQFSGSPIEEPGTLQAPAMPGVATTGASQIKAKTAMLNGNLTSNGGAKITERGFVYVASATDVVPTIGTAGHTKVGNTASVFTNAFSETIADLAPNTKYYFRAFATNSVGTEYGGVETFTTPALSHLASLHLSGGMLTPAFSPATLNYTVFVDNFTSAIDLVPTVSDAAATVKINGADVVSGSGTANIPLMYGDNPITVLVTAGDGTTSTYTVTVNRGTTSANKGMANHLVISEVYGGAGNAGPFSHDFVELYNPTDAPISVGGWSVQVSGPDGTTWTKTNLPTKTIPAKAFFLIQGVTGTGTTPISVFDDFHSTAININPMGGKVLLVNNNVFVTGANPTGGHIIDKVGWGETPVPTGFEGMYASAFTATGSLERKATSYSSEASMASGGADETKGNGFDSHDNSFDFVMAATPNPQHLGSSTETPGDIPAPVVPTLSTTAANAITVNSATVGGEVTAMGGAKVDERGVVYMASATAVTPEIGMTGAMKQKSATAGAGAFTETLNGLSPMTKYYARSYAMNVAGTAYGSTVEFTTAASGNAALTDLGISAGTLSPAFAPGTTSYTASVPFSTSSMTVTPTLTDPTATVMVNGTAVANGAASAAIPLNVGSNTITAVVTAQNGTTTRTYTIMVDREGAKGVGSIANHVVISEVSGGGGNTSSAYQSDYVELYNPTSSDIVMTDWSVQHAASDGTTWTKAVFTGTIKAKGYFLVRGFTGAGTAPLENYDATVTGSSTLSISAIRGKVVLVSNSTTVTGANPTGDEIVDKLGWGSTGAIPTGFETTPSVNTAIATAIHRKAHANATATSMAASGADAEKGNGYDSDNNFYDFVIAAPDPQWSGSATETLGNTPAVQAPMVSTTAAGSVRFTSAMLGGNVTSDGGAAVTERGVVYVASETEVMPTIGTTGHVKVASGAGRGSFSEAMTGLVARTKYYVRAFATNAAGTTYGALESFTTSGATVADLSMLTISAGTLTPAFATGVTSYSATVPYTVSSVTISPTLTDPNASVIVNNSPLTGSGSADVPLVVGENRINVLVTAEDGTTTKTYSILVTRTVSSNANMSGLALSAGTLAPAFDAATLSYTASVGHSVESITVTPTLSDVASTVTVNGTTVANGSASGNIPLTVGANTIAMVVTAQDGTTAKTYTVVVTRATVTSVAGELVGAPAGLTAPVLYPNPVQTHSTVKFGLPKSSVVQAQVFSAAGVKVLEKGLGTFAAGYHDVTWLSAGEASGALAPGAYVLRLVTNSGVVSVRFVVTK